MVRFNNDTPDGAGAGASEPTYEDTQPQRAAVTGSAGVPSTSLNDTTASFLQNRLLLLWVQLKDLTQCCTQN